MSACTSPSTNKCVNSQICSAHPFGCTTAMIGTMNHTHISNKVEGSLIRGLCGEISELMKESYTRHMIGEFTACILPVNILWLCDSVTSGSFSSGEIEGYCSEGSPGGAAAVVETVTPFAKAAGCWPSAHADKLRQHAVPGK